MEELNTNETLSCASCLNNIGDDDYVSALGQDWHKECFRCSVCDELLSSWYFEKAGLLFCQNDYWARYGESCQQCAQVITGPVMAAGDHRFHPECFACVACCSHIEDGQPYALLERSNLYCGGCYSTLDRKSAHAIRALEVPKTALRADRTNGLTFTQVDSSCGLLTLHIGDRILEINGTPVRNRPIEEIEKVLARPDTVIQLTVEHDPETTNTRREDKQISPPERKLHRDEHSIDIPERRLEEEEVGGKRERLFKRKGDGGGKVRVIKRRQTPSSPLLGDKERSSSMSKLLDAMCGVDGEHCSEGNGGGVLRDLSRARSFRAHPDSGQRVFRACDLLQGELLGSGFFGEVYKVTHRDTNEVMVLKQLYRVDEDAQRNFLKEVAVLRSLDHPHVLRFIGVLYKDKRLHLVTEFVGGGTLHQVIQDELRWWERARLARDVAAGVGYLHRMNLIHRDLNSHNCLVRDDRSVVVADFGLARIVRRTASSTLDRRTASASLRRKRYTVVGNPYWMAPEMMNGDVYDEKVDVFSFGIILCEIIGRVSADPDYLPRRGDFGLNECAFIDKFCGGAEPCPEALYRLAFLACHLDPEHRPPFEVMEIWLESLAVGLRADARFDGGAVLSDIAQYASRGGGALRRSPSKAAAVAPAAPCAPRVALGKCVSASHIGARVVRVAKARRSRSHHSLHHTPGYILRAHHDGIDITPVDDITEWLDPPPPLKRTSPDDNLHHIPSDRTDCATKTRRVDHQDQGNLPSFLRNQSYEELEAHCKVDAPLPMCRHFSIPDDDCTTLDDTDSSDDDLTTDSKWYKNVTKFKKLDKMEVDQPKNILANIVKKGENFLSKKSSYDVTDVNLRNPECLNERKLPEIDCRRFNIDHLTKNKLMAEGVKNIARNFEACKPDKTEKSVFSPTKLLSPKLKRLFKPNSAEVVRNKQDISDKEEKSRSKFFVQRPASPSNICRSSYRVRPAEDDRKPTINERKLGNNIIKADLKLASLGKPMTPIFRRHFHTERPEFADGRFSYRDRSKQEPKFVDIGRNRIKAPITGAVDKNVQLAPILRSAQKNKAPALTIVPEKSLGKKREPGISRSNYVSLANLKINSKGKDLDDNVGVSQRANLNDCSKAERVI